MEYPWTLNYKELCPKKDTCSGFITYPTKRGLGVYYCHERMCLEIWDRLKDCPCDDNLECQGSQWIDGIEICILRAGVTKENAKIPDKKYGYIYVK